MINCKDCKWWMKYNHKEVRGLWGRCAKSITKHGEPNHASKMLAHAGGRDYCYANTTKDFGCVMGEKRDEGYYRFEDWLCPCVQSVSAWNDSQNWTFAAA